MSDEFGDELKCCLFCGILLWIESIEIIKETEKLCQ